MSATRRRQASPSGRGASPGGSIAARWTVPQARARAVVWSQTRDASTPWRATVDAQAFTLRLNDCPEEPLYTLFVDGSPVGALNDWPKTWSKDPQ